MKLLFIGCLVFINYGKLNASNIDSSRNHFFEISYFKSPTTKSGIFKIDQRGINLKTSFEIFKVKKFNISLNPFYTNLTNVMYRGNFIDKPAIEAFSILKLRANSVGIGLGIERKLTSKLKIRCEFGISNTSYSLFSRRDRIKDSSNCSNPNDSAYHITLFNYKEKKLSNYISLTLRYKLNNRLSFSLGYLYRTINYDLFMQTYYYTCGLLQSPFANMRPSVSNLSLGICYNFSLDKFK